MVKVSERQRLMRWRECVRLSLTRAFHKQSNFISPSVLTQTVLFIIRGHRPFIVPISQSGRFQGNQCRFIRNYHSFQGVEEGGPVKR